MAFKKYVTRGVAGPSLFLGSGIRFEKGFYEAKSTMEERYIEHTQSFLNGNIVALEEPPAQLVAQAPAGEPKPSNPTKSELFAQAEALGLKVSSRDNKATITASIEAKLAADAEDQTSDTDEDNTTDTDEDTDTPNDEG